MGRRVKTRSDFRAAMSLLAQNACSDIMEEDSISSSAVASNANANNSVGGGSVGLQMRRLNSSTYQAVKQQCDDDLALCMSVRKEYGKEGSEAEVEKTGAETKHREVSEVAIMEPETVAVIVSSENKLKIDLADREAPDEKRNVVVDSKTGRLEDDQEMQPEAVGSTTNLTLAVKIEDEVKKVSKQ